MHATKHRPVALANLLLAAFTGLTVASVASPGTKRGVIPWTKRDDADGRPDGYLEFKEDLRCVLTIARDTGQARQWRNRP